MAEVKEVKQKKIADMTLREARDYGMKVVRQMEDLGKQRGDGAWTEDKEKQFDGWDKECNEVDVQIRMLARKEQYEAEQARHAEKVGEIRNLDEEFDPTFKPSNKQVRRTLKKFEQRERNIKFLNAEERKILALMDFEERAFEELFRSGLRPDLIKPEERAIISAMETRAQSLTTTAGGFTVPTGFIPRIILYFKYISAFFQEYEYPDGGLTEPIFDVYRTDTGNDLPVSTGDDTGNVGELLGENSDASSSSADLVFGQKTFKAYQYSTKMIKSSNVLLQDTGVDLVGYIAKCFGSRLGRILNTHFTTGDGSAKPSGIVTGLSLGKLGGTSGTISFTEIIDLVHSVDKSYRDRPSTRFMLHDKILALLKKATVGASTTNSRPLWAPGWDVSAPPTIDGTQYLVNNDLDSTFAAGKKVMLYGDMKTFGIRWVNELRLRRFEERYGEFDQTAWVGFMRADARLLNTSGIKYYAGT